jgi:hypothetical protein
MKRVNTNEPNKVLAFVREKNGNQVFVILNLSKDHVNITLDGDKYVGEYCEIFKKKDAADISCRLNFVADESICLKPWEYRVFVK